MSIDPNRLHHLITLRDDRLARLHAAGARVRDENARRWKSLKTVEGLEVRIAETVFPDERERLSTDLLRTQEQLSASQARLATLKDEEARLGDEWRAAARLANAAEAYAADRGVKVEPPPVIGPDIELARRADGSVHA